MRSPATLALVTACLPACLTGGCGSLASSGFVVENGTDRVVHVELLRLERGGEMRPYARQVVSPGAQYKHMVDDEEFRRGLRARFTVDGETVEDGNWVMLQIGQDKERRYDLKLVNGRLTARDVAKRGAARTWSDGNEEAGSKSR